MAIYTNRSNVEQYLNADLSDIDSAVTSWITAASKIIDAYVGYAFSAENTTKYYDLPKGGKILFTDRFTGSPTVTVYNADGSVFKTLEEGVGKDFVTQPYNEGYQDQIVLLRNPYFFDYIIDEDEEWIGEKRFAVTASFGYGASVPEDITLACTMIVANIAEKRLKGGSPKSESLGDYSITYKDVESMSEFSGIKTILDHYTEPAI